jgi:hypothetical protein
MPHLRIIKVIENDNQYQVTLRKIMYLENSINEALNTKSKTETFLLAAHLSGMSSILFELINDAVLYKIKGHDNGKNT